MDIIQKNNWGEKNNFVQKFFNDNNIEYSNLELYFNNSDMSYFIQFPNTSDNKYNTHAYGVNYNKFFKENKINLLLNYTSHNNIISDYSIIKSNNSLTDSQSVDLGFIYSLNNKVDFFARHKRDYLKANQATNYNLSIDSGYASSETLGMEYKRNNHQLNFGIYTPVHFENSEFKFMSPSGRGANGDIYWQNKTFTVDNDVNYSPYISYKAQLRNILPQFKDSYLSINMTQSPYNNNMVEAGQIQFSTKF